MERALDEIEAVGLPRAAVRLLAARHGDAAFTPSMRYHLLGLLHFLSAGDVAHNARLAEAGAVPVLLQYLNYEAAAAAAAPAGWAAAAEPAVPGAPAAAAPALQAEESAPLSDLESLAGDAAADAAPAPAAPADNGDAPGGPAGADAGRPALVVKEAAMTLCNMLIDLKRVADGRPHINDVVAPVLAYLRRHVPQPREPRAAPRLSAEVRRNPVALAEVLGVARLAVQQLARAGAEAADDGPLAMRPAHDLVNGMADVVKAVCGQDVPPGAEGRMAQLLEEAALTLFNIVDDGA
jgi:hypothetical protein